MVCESVKVIFNREVLTEVKEFLQLVTVSIELTMEVLCDEPVWFKEFFRTCETECSEKEMLKLVVGNSVFLT